MLNRKVKAKVVLLEKGSDRIEKALDVTNIIHLQDIFRNLINLNYDRAEKMLLLN